LGLEPVGPAGFTGSGSVLVTLACVHQEAGICVGTEN
jgi:hypothetical protein